MNSKIWAFCIYSVAYEAIIWGLFGYVVFWQNHSGWWMVLAVVMSMSQLKPKSFGIGDANASDTTVLESIKMQCDAPNVQISWRAEMPE